MSKSEKEIKEYLKNLRNKWSQKRIYTLNSVKDLEEDARIAKVRINDYGAYDKNIFRDLDIAIESAEELIKSNNMDQENSVRKAAEYLINGLDSFFIKTE